MDGDHIATMMIKVTGLGPLWDQLTYSVHLGTAQGKASVGQPGGKLDACYWSLCSCLAGS